MNGILSFNTNNLQNYDPVTDTGIITNKINHTGLPDKTVSLYNIANASSSAIPFIDYPSKTITISGVIKAPSDTELDQQIDLFKSYFNGKDKDLDINFAGSTRRYIATVNSMGITRSGALLFAEFNVEFICTQPFGQDITATEMYDSTTTIAVFTETPTIAGTAPLQLPVFTITINALTGDGDYIQISNDKNSQEILIYGYNLSDGDVLIIDCAKRIVTLNDVLIDYTGVFLELETGTAEISYTDGFITRNIDVQAEYIKRYL